LFGFSLIEIAIFAAVVGFVWWLFNSWHQPERGDASSRARRDRGPDDSRGTDDAAGAMPLAAIAATGSTGQAAAEPVRTDTLPASESSTTTSPSTGGDSGGSSTSDSGGGGGGGSND
jgi:hypothetical protein